MEKRFVDYLDGLYPDIPASVYVVLSFFFLLCAVLAYSTRGFRQGNKIVIWLITMEYIFLIFYVTVIQRPYSERINHNFMPFWSYGAIQNGSLNLFPVIVMNVVMFIPVGFLIGCVSRLAWSNVLFIGLCISVTIETLQFLLKKGFSELDDVIHNTLGCLIGFSIVAVINVIWKFCTNLFVAQWGKHRAHE